MKKLLAKIVAYFEIFAGIGGGRVAAHPIPELYCVGAVEWESNARAVYWANHGEHSYGDIWSVDPSDIEPMDIVMMSPPCTPYSRAGKRLGLKDPAGQVVFGALPIIERHMPAAIIWENVVGFTSHNRGQTIRNISAEFEKFGYHPLYESWRTLDSSKFGLPTKRIRFYGTMLRKDFDPSLLVWPNPLHPMVPLRTVLLPSEDVRNLSFPRTKYIRHDAAVSVRKPYQLQFLGYFDHDYRDRFVYGVDGPACTFCRQTSGIGGASSLYDVEGVVRKLHPREMLRAMGYGDDFVIPMPYNIATGLIGNSLCPPVLTEVYRMVLRVISRGEFQS